MDTSALLAAIDRREVDHARVSASLASEPGPLVIPAGILSEICYFLEHRIGQPTLALFLENLSAGEFLLDWNESDLPRISELVRRYHDLPLGYADAAVIACAERHGGKVMTLDLRHFGAVAREGTISIVP